MSTAEIPTTAQENLLTQIQQPYIDIPPEKKHLLEYINQSVIGGHDSIKTPYGFRKITYCDYIASGKSLSFIEDYVRSQILPSYSNTHTTTSRTGLQTSCFREEARDIIINSTNCGPNDTVIFCGSGATSSANKLVHMLGIEPTEKAHEGDFDLNFVAKTGMNWDQTEEEIMKDLEISAPVVVFVDQLNHHSNILPWREAGAKIVNIPLNSETDELNIIILEELLQKYSSIIKKFEESSKKKLKKIGAFSAGSNVTGIENNVNIITALLHKYEFLAVWDYACAAPYVSIDMNPRFVENEYSGEGVHIFEKDAVFFSMHKFIGGPQTPGILIVKKNKILCNPVPSLPGGGTILWVTPNSHKFINKTSEREEGGTPDIVGSVRAALCFQLKSAICSNLPKKEEETNQLQSMNFENLIEAKETDFYLRAMKFLTKNENIVVLGNPNLPRCTSVVSFVVRHGKFTLDPKTGEEGSVLLHYNFVGALLNDLFGIQVRGGCMCANPYGSYLLGINEKDSKKFERFVDFLQKNGRDIASINDEDEEKKQIDGENDASFELLEFLRPGFVRMSFNYFLSEEEFQFILKAIDWVANEGWKLLPFYTYQPSTGQWYQVHNKKFKDRKWLHDISYAEGKMTFPNSVSDGLTFIPKAFGKKDEDIESKMENKLKKTFNEYFAEAEAAADRCVIDVAKKTFSVTELMSQEFNLPKIPNSGSEDFDKVRWFWYPSEIAEEIRARYTVIKRPKTDKTRTHDILQGMSLENYLKSIASKVFSDSENKSEEERSRYNFYFIKFSKATAQSSKIFNPLTYINNKKQLLHQSKKISSSSSSSFTPFDQIVQKLQSEAPVVQEIAHKPQEKPHKIEEYVEESSVFPSDLEESPKEEEETSKSTKKQNQDIWPKIPKKIIGPFKKAIADYKMIQEGDKVMVGLSGGKDSLSLLHAICEFKKHVPVNFTIGACTVDPQVDSYDPSILKKYLKTLGIPYFYEQQGIIESAKTCSADSICAFCSRIKRGILYNTCRREGYNVLALGQHLDDMAEAFLMSIFHNGFLRTQKVHYKIDANDIRVIRPLCYVRERELRKFAEEAGLPIINENCPACFQIPTERARIKTLLKNQEVMYPALFNSLSTAMQPLYLKDLDGGLEGDDEDEDISDKYAAPGVCKKKKKFKSSTLNKVDSKLTQIEGLEIKKEEAEGAEGEQEKEKEKKNEKRIEDARKKASFERDCNERMKLVPTEMIEEEIKRRMKEQQKK